MDGITRATVIILTRAERSKLEGLVRSTKTERRLRQRARIVLMAAEGMASRAIGRAVGCTTGAASKWRVRYGEKLTDLTKRATGVASQNTPRKRTNTFWRCWINPCPRGILAGQDRSWRRPSAMLMCSISGASRRLILQAQILVRGQLSGVHCQGGRRSRALHGPAGEAPVIDQAEPIRYEVVMRQHRTLGTAGGA
jgi:Homeodomain-like domain